MHVSEGFRFTLHLRFLAMMMVAEKEGIYTMSSVEERVRKIIAEQLSVKEEDVTSDASFIEDLGADSLDAIEIAMKIEEDFDITIDDDDVEKMNTLSLVLKYIKANADVD